MERIKKEGYISSHVLCDMAEQVAFQAVSDWSIDEKQQCSLLVKLGEEYFNHMPVTKRRRCVVLLIAEAVKTGHFNISRNFENEAEELAAATANLITCMAPTAPEEEHRPKRRRKMINKLNL